MCSTGASPELLPLLDTSSTLRAGPAPAGALDTARKPQPRPELRASVLRDRRTRATGSHWRRGSSDYSSPLTLTGPASCSLVPGGGPSAGRRGRATRCPQEAPPLRLRPPMPVSPGTSPRLEAGEAPRPGPWAGQARGGPSPGVWTVTQNQPRFQISTAAHGVRMQSRKIHITSPRAGNALGSSLSSRRRPQDQRETGPAAAHTRNPARPLP